MEARRGAKELVRPLASRLMGSVHGARTCEPVVAFTFDDGPNEDVTPKVLDALADFGARATFFILGEQARRHPELVRRIGSSGHEIGSHSDVHRALTEPPLREVARDIARAKRDLECITGKPIRLFRPPFGFLTKGGYVVARSLALDVVAWSAHANDWLERPIDELVATAFSQLRPGGILLLHDGLKLPERADAPLPPTFDREALVRKLLCETARRGWRSVSVGELISGRPVDRRLWFRLPAPSTLVARGRDLSGRAGGNP